MEVVGFSKLGGHVATHYCLYNAKYRRLIRYGLVVKRVSRPSEYPCPRGERTYVRNT